jgi:hypothetical protein
VRPDEWGALAERCEGVKVASREIDALIWQGIYPSCSLKHAHRGFFIPAQQGETPLSAVRVGDHEPSAVAASFGAPPLTESIDAITAMICLHLPTAIIENARWWGRTDVPPKARISLWDTYPDGHREAGWHSGKDHWRVEALGTTEALARCAVFCRAMAVR